MRDYLFAVTASICLGTIGIFVKLIGSEIHFMTLNFFRVFFGFLFLLAVVPFLDRKAFSISKKDARDYFLIGLMIAVSFSTYNMAMLLAPVQNVVMIGNFSVFFVMITGYLLLREKVTKTKLITLIIALVGLSIINPFDITSVAITGNLLAFADSFLYALILVEMRREDTSHTIGDVLWFFLFASLVLSPAPFIFGLGNLSGVIMYVILLGAVSTGMTYLFLNLSLERIEAEMASIVSLLVSSVAAIVLAVAVISEPPHPAILLGGGIVVLAGIYLELHRKNLKTEGDIFNVFRQWYEKRKEGKPFLRSG